MTETTNQREYVQDERATRIASEMRDLHTRRKAIDERIDELKAALLDTDIPEGTTLRDADNTPVGKVRRAGRRFDPMKAATILPQAAIDQISTMQIDPKVAKIKLPPAVYEECMTTGTMTFVMSRL